MSSDVVGTVAAAEDAAAEMAAGVLMAADFAELRRESSDAGVREGVAVEVVESVKGVEFGSGEV
jgi:hypothetical protein